MRKLQQMEKHSQEEAEAARNSDVEKVRREKIRDGERVHAVVAPSTFGSQQSKVSKHRSFGRLLEVAMSKECRPLWREAHLEVKSGKTRRPPTTFGS